MNCVASWNTEEMIGDRRTYQACKNSVDQPRYLKVNDDVIVAVLLCSAHAELIDVERKPPFESAVLLEGP